MEEVLKGLEGKTLTKKKLFNFLADIDLEELCGNKPLNIKLPKSITKPESKDISEIKCNACSKTFTVENSLKRHYTRYPACVKWIEKNEMIKE